MTYDYTLNKPSIDELLAQMMLLPEDVVFMQKRLDNKQSIPEKIKEIQLIQKLIIAKRADEKPLK